MIVRNLFVENARALAVKCEIYVGAILGRRGENFRRIRGTEFSGQCLYVFFDGGVSVGGGWVVNFEWRGILPKFGTSAKTRKVGLIRTTGG